MILPLVLNTLSDGELVAQIDSYFLARCDEIGRDISTIVGGQISFQVEGTANTE